jgi:hypothetical protein
MGVVKTFTQGEMPEIAISDEFIRTFGMITSMVPMNITTLGVLLP